MDFQQILNHARRGVHQTPTLPGLRHPSIKGSLEFATTDIDTLKNWASDGYAGHNWVSVAKKGSACILDIDDPNQAQRLAMPNYDDTFVVNSPSPGHKQAYYSHTAASEELGNCNVLGSDGKPVVEFKAHNLTCASPGVKRTDKEPHGEYVPANDLPIKPLPQEMVDWLKKNSSKKKTSFRHINKSDFHPSFDRDDWIEHYELSATGEEKTVEGVLYVELSECPFVGRAHEGQHKGSFKCCVTFGNRIGFKCMAGGCQDKDINDLKEFLSEEHDIEEYEYLIYVEDDDDLLFNSPNFSVADADVPEPQSPEAVVAFLNDETPQTEAEPEEPQQPEIDTTGFNYRKTDTGNAERLVRRFGDRIRYVRDIGEWRVWDEKRWAPDTHGIIDRLAKKVAQEIFDEAKGLEDDERTPVLRWAIISEAKDRRNAMIDLASKERTVVTVINDYDRDPWLFNCQNGTIDLHMGKLKPHDPADMITTISPVVLDPKAECPQWLAFLNEVMGSDQQMVDFLSRATGYTLSADTSAQAMFFPYGDGCNGKGVFLEVVRYVMGGYGKDTSFETFVITRNKNEARNDLAGLVGARFVTASESQDGHKLDEALIKRLTGGDPITCRKLHHEFFTFYPNFKIWMHSNYKPVIRGTDWGIWRRLKCIPFEVTIPDDKRDEQLAPKLKTEASGILNWMLKGMADYLKFGMMYPDKVNEATTKYRESQDVVGRFLGDKCVIAEYAESKQTEMYTAFTMWAEANREHVMKESQFSDAMRKRFGKPRHKADGNYWQGVGLKTTTHQPNVDPESVL
jgi:P4 family phage/plasmid primase-like protien